MSGGRVFKQARAPTEMSHQASLHLGVLVDDVVPLYVADKFMAKHFRRKGGFIFLTIL